MQVIFRTKKLKQQYMQSEKAVRAYGEAVARKYIERINIINKARSFSELSAIRPLRCHPLKGNRKHQYAIILTGIYRLIFTLKGDSLEVVRIEEVSKHYDD